MSTLRQMKVMTWQAWLIVALLAPFAGVGGYVAADHLRGSTRPTVDGRTVDAKVDCSVAKVGVLLPVSLGNGCKEANGQTFVPGLRMCQDGSLLYAEGDGESVVVGVLGTVAQGGQAAFRTLAARCTP